MLRAVQIEAVYWSYSDDATPLVSLRATTSAKYRDRQWDVRETDFTDYRLAAGPVSVFVRDGGEQLLDPEKEADPVLVLRQKKGARFRVVESVCHTRGRFTAGILVAAVRPPNVPSEPYYGTPSVYFSAQAEEREHAVEVLKKIVLRSRFYSGASQVHVELDDELKKFIAEKWE